MEEDKVINIQSQPPRFDYQNQNEGLSGYGFGEKVSFTVGISYLVASILGMARGSLIGFPTNYKLPKKLLLNNFFNAVGKTQSSFGQAAASASLIYYLTGGTLNFLFEDELADFTPIQKNLLCGFVSGAIYKSTLGFRPAIVGSILGGSLIGGMTYLTDYFYERGTIAF